MTPDPPPQPVGLCGCGEPLFAEDDVYACPDCLLTEAFLNGELDEEKP